jgi:hypothetical protein
LRETSLPSAAQVFDAALRAEAEGNLESAARYYRNLSEQHGDAPEAVAARVALSRITAPRTAAPGAHHPPMLPWQHNGAHSDWSGPRRSPIRIAPVGSTDARQSEELPEPVRRYVAGRILAHTLTGLGAVAALLAAFLVLARTIGFDAFLGVVGLQDLVANPVLGLVALAGGLAAYFIGQLALAVFDGADASRELVAHARAKAETGNQNDR